MLIVYYYCVKSRLAVTSGKTDCVQCLMAEGTKDFLKMLRLALACSIKYWSVFCDIPSLQF